MNDIEKAQACVVFYMLGIAMAAAGAFAAFDGRPIGIAGIVIGAVTTFISMQQSDKIHKKYKDKKGGNND